MPAILKRRDVELAIVPADGFEVARLEPEATTQTLASCWTMIEQLTLKVRLLTSGSIKVYNFELQQTARGANLTLSE